MAVLEESCISLLLVSCLSENVVSAFVKEREREESLTCRLHKRKIEEMISHPLNRKATEEGKRNCPGSKRELWRA